MYFVAVLFNKNKNKSLIKKFIEENLTVCVNILWIEINSNYEAIIDIKNVHLFKQSVMA